MAAVALLGGVWGGVASAHGPSPTAADVAKIGHGEESHHICVVLKSGEVLCSGLNSSGQLGVGDTVDRVGPVPMTGVSDAVDAAMGEAFTCVLRRGGGVRCVGRGLEGQIGAGSVFSETVVPMDVLNESGTAPLIGATALAAGDANACVVASGRVLCWGTLYSILTVDPITGDVTGYDSVSSTLPVAVPGITDAVGVALGDDAACAVRQTGNVVCWGVQTAGQLGRGVEDNAVLMAPAAVLNESGTAPLADVASVRGGELHFCAVLKDGGYVCWGGSYFAQLGDGMIYSDRSVPTPTAATMAGTAQPLTGIVMSAPGAYHSCALSSAGYVYCSGGGFNGSLGAGALAKTPSSRAVTVTERLGGPPLTDVVEIASTYDASCARTASGVVYCWGRNSEGQLGVFSTEDQLSPVVVYTPSAQLPNP